MMILKPSPSSFPGYVAMCGLKELVGASMEYDRVER